jgi:hypothetical protein
MHISPTRRELSPAMTEPEATGLPVRHRLGRFQIDPISLAGTRHLGYREVQGEAALQSPGGPVNQILSDDYSPEGKYLYFLHNGRLPIISITARAASSDRVAQGGGGPAGAPPEPGELHG